LSDETDRASADPAAEGGVQFHNPVLTRSHEPARSGSHSWLMIIPLAVVLVAGLAFWLYVSSHPAAAWVNRSVMTSPPAAAAPGAPAKSATD